MKVKESRENVPGQCNFWVSHKSRFCKLASLNGQFCGEHDAARILCPYSANQHLRICVAKPKPLPDHHLSDLHWGRQDSGDLVKAKDAFKDIEKDDLLAFMAQVEDWYETCNPVIRDSVLSHEAMSEKVSSTTIGKHAHQQSSLLGNMRDLGLTDDNVTFVEMGAGRAELSNYLFEVVGPEARYVFVDRAHPKLKINSKFKTLPIWHRETIDIKDLNLPLLLSNLAYNRPVVALSKHLCGIATDLTLSCLFHHLDSGHKVNGLVIALCCHQICRYESYINPTFLTKLGISGFDFGMMMCLSTWAICGQRPECLPDVREPIETEDEDVLKAGHWSGLLYEQRQELGYKCKRILDMGRLEALQDRGFKSELISYVNPSTSLEHVALVATHL